jgi:hypothetical protein
VHSAVACNERPAPPTAAIWDAEAAFPEDAPADVAQVRAFPGRLGLAQSQTLCKAARREVEFYSFTVTVPVETKGERVHGTRLPPG